MPQLVNYDIDHLLVFGYPQSFTNVQVDITPPEGRWRLDNGPWQEGGAVLYNVPLGGHTISFSEVDGWNKPEDIDDLTISSYCGAIALSGEYEAICYGELTVNIKPTEAVTDGAKWSVDNGEPWHDSGETIELIPGEYTVTFKTLNCWEKSESKPVTVVCDEEVIVNEVMELMEPGSLKVTIIPQEAVDTGAQWSIDDGMTAEKHLIYLAVTIPLRSKIFQIGLNRLIFL
ncbi:hypothetical protein QUF90_13270 [Desulfococcaceae bacterium HSG9]|nr:hypothetical protein [Desulfococcaceae bacterium HSG9]